MPITVQKHAESGNKLLLRTNGSAAADPFFALRETRGPLLIYKDEFRHELFNYLEVGRHNTDSYDSISQGKLNEIADSLTLEYLTTSPIVMSKILKMYSKGGEDKETAKGYMGWIYKYSPNGKANAIGLFIAVRNSSEEDVVSMDGYTASNIYRKGLMQMGVAESCARKLTNTVIEGRIRSDNKIAPP
ncbi:MAG: hypothetical protein KGI06_05255 [Candidatus Micrarchaeota archaeon]|nr:hypothetical protein [Candidatus Micrarchaeota archaeon]